MEARPGAQHVRCVALRCAVSHQAVPLTHRSAPGPANWKKRWCVLEGSVLRYYTSFDPKTHTPVGEKGVVMVAGSSVRAAPLKGRRAPFLLEHDERRTLYLDIDFNDAPRTRDMWLDYLEQASKGQVAGSLADKSGKAAADAMRLLGMPASLGFADATAKKIGMAYRRKALSAHPDKGGDPEAFEAIRLAYEMLCELKREETNAENYDDVECVLRLAAAPTATQRLPSSPTITLTLPPAPYSPGTTPSSRSSRRWGSQSKHLKKQTRTAAAFTSRASRAPR